MLSAPRLTVRCAFLIVGSILLALQQQTSAQPGFQVLHTFVDRVATPSTLTRTQDGVIYGTSGHGGIGDAGFVFTLTQDSGGKWVREIVHEFTGSEGRSVADALVEGPDGALYGATQGGGLDPTNGQGALFRLTRSGAFTVLHHFPLMPGQVGVVVGRMLFGNDGALYGLRGRDFFKFDLGTNQFSIVHHFTTGEGYPATGLILASDGKFYGTALSAGDLLVATPIGIADAQSRLFSLTPDGTLTFLHTFNCAPYCGHAPDGSDPVGGVVQGPDGKLYGATREGGDPNPPSGLSISQSFGTVYRVNLDGSNFEVLHRFNSAHPAPQLPTGAFPTLPLRVGPDGGVYGIAGWGQFDNGVIFRAGTDGSFSVRSLTDDEGVPVSLIAGAPGPLLGVANWDDAHLLISSGQIGGHRLMFDLAPTGEFSVEHIFYLSGNGFPPGSPLVQGTDGAWYGTTPRGGSSGRGLVYRLVPGGGVTSFHDFEYHADGYRPEGLMRASDGNFYGLATSGGVNHRGLIYRLTPAGVYSVVREFDTTYSLGSSDLIEGPNGALYTIGSASGQVSVLRLNQDGTFTPFPLGVTPISIWQSPVVDADGTIHVLGDGQILRVDPTGVVNVVHAFASGVTPLSIVRGADGALYGTTIDSASADTAPTVFRLAPAGTSARCTRSTGASTGCSALSGSV